MNRNQYCITITLCSLLLSGKMHMLDCFREQWCNTRLCWHGFLAFFVSSLESQKTSAVSISHGPISSVILKDSSFCVQISAEDVSFLYTIKLKSLRSHKEEFFFL